MSHLRLVGNSAHGKTQSSPQFKYLWRKQDPLLGNLICLSAQPFGIKYQHVLELTSALQYINNHSKKSLLVVHSSSLTRYFGINESGKIFEKVGGVKKSTIFDVNENLALFVEEILDFCRS